jgi:hypothetical protein
MYIPEVCEHVTLWLYRKNDDCFTAKAHIRVNDSTIKLEYSFHGQSDASVCLELLGQAIRDTFDNERREGAEF